MNEKIYKGIEEILGAVEELSKDSAPLKLVLSPDKIRPYFPHSAEIIQISDHNLKSLVSNAQGAMMAMNPHAPKQAFRDFMHGMRKFSFDMDPREDILPPFKSPHFSTNLKENWLSSTKWEKFGRVSAVGAGAVLLGKAVSFDRCEDDNGKEPHPLLQIIDGTAGAALIAAGLLIRGSNRIIT